MEKKKCENKYGMITSNKEIVKHHEFSRAFSIFNHYSEEKTHASLPKSGDEIDAHQIGRWNVDRWQQRIVENIRHNALR